MLKASFYRGSGAEVNLMHGAICPRKVLEEKDEFGVICIVSSFQFRSIMRKKQILCPVSFSSVSKLEHRK